MCKFVQEFIWEYVEARRKEDSANLVDARSLPAFNGGCGVDVFLVGQMVGANNIPCSADLNCDYPIKSVKPLNGYALTGLTRTAVSHFVSVRAAREYKTVEHDKSRHNRSGHECENGRDPHH
ncbi:MAG: hypothetical protein ONB44_00240 [candidate division KSB1 bacterium]|nr:hypothetical protein [candidate division KSB1 bacterium]MDZ7300550.1 hypothetical protein [candidate division KSB1 bacterium]MDZ7309689.1 hypothetical protein [candidate division KSB1 bacterium]